jgi:hypothetical protein
MPRKLEDIVSDIGYTFVSKDKKFLTFICSKGHESTEKRVDFNNTKIRYQKEGKDLTSLLCRKCRDKDYLTYTEFIHLMGHRFGHYDMVMVDTHTISYNCGSCGYQYDTSKTTDTEQTDCNDLPKRTSI